jgi:hypothetical protein
MRYDVTTVVAGNPEISLKSYPKKCREKLLCRSSNPLEENGI